MNPVTDINTELMINVWPHLLCFLTLHKNRAHLEITWHYHTGRTFAFKYIPPADAYIHTHVHLTMYTFMSVKKNFPERLCRCTAPHNICIDSTLVIMCTHTHGGVNVPGEP